MEAKTNKIYNSARSTSLRRLKKTLQLEAAERLANIESNRDWVSTARFVNQLGDEIAAIDEKEKSSQVEAPVIQSPLADAQKRFKVVG